MPAEDLWLYKLFGAQEHRAHGLPEHLDLPRLQVPPQAGDHRRLRLDLRAPGHVLLDRGDLGAGEGGRRRGLPLHRVVPRASARGRPQAARAGATASSAARATSTGIPSSIRSWGRWSWAAGTSSPSSAIRRRSTSSARCALPATGSRGRRSRCRAWSCFKAEVDAPGRATPGSVRLAVHNTGYLPSYVTKRALERKVARGVIYEIELPDGRAARLGQGALRGRPARRAREQVLAAGLPAQSRPRRRTAASASGRCGRPRAPQVTVVARHDRAGKVAHSLRLA